MAGKLNKWDKRHLLNLNSIQKQIDKIYYAATREIVRICIFIHKLNPEKPFSLADYPVANKMAEKIFSKLENDIEAVIVNGVRSEWTLANNKNNELCNRVFGDNRHKLTKEQERRYYSNNGKALEAFQARKSAGMNLSDRVWSYTNQFKAEIEMGLDLGLRNGKPADEIARDLKQYLKEPNMLFRRVRDEHGQLRLSNAAKAYHPGAGVYRSSYKNALRLARTETNMAYRTSDHTRWQQMDFVVGIEIHLSNNHTLNGRAFTDICDELQGKYPKDFKFTGWHPQCRCHAISILKTEDELEADSERIMNGEYPTNGSVNSVTGVPENFKKWAINNRKKIVMAEKNGALPYFLRDNQEYTRLAFRGSGVFNAGYLTTEAKGITPTEKLDLSGVNSAMEEVAKMSSEYFQRGYVGVFAAPDGEQYFMSTDIDGKIFVNFAKKDGFDAGASLVSAFDKIAKKVSLTRDEEYSIEILWHEMLHNKTKNTAILPPIDAINTGFQRVVAETINQLVARKTYPEFLQQLGGTARHASWVLENGYGYSATVSNMRKLVEALGIDENLFAREANKLLMQDYTDFDEKIGGLLEKMSPQKHKSNAARIFRYIEVSDFDRHLKILNK